MPSTNLYPYSAIVAIDTTIGGVNHSGSGVLVSPTEVLTAAHMVWDYNKGAATSIVVYPGYDNGLSQFGFITGTVTHYNPINDSGDTIRLPDVHNDYAVIHLDKPTNAGSMALGADYGGGSAFVSGYPWTGETQLNSAQTLRVVPSPYSYYVGADLGPGSSGGPVWTVDANGATVVGVVSSGQADGVGYFAEITMPAKTTIQSWMAQDAAISPNVAYTNSRTGKQGAAALQAASGGPSYLKHQYIWASADGVALTTSMPNTFLRGGAGQDALQVSSGQNVLDGGTGSNFLTGGVGNDTFFTDARGSAPVWNTIRNFHAGDAATVWGFTPGVSSYWWDSQASGAAGSTGATLRANIVGGAGRAGDGVDASITFAGLSVEQAKALHVSTGTQPAGSYLYLSNITA